MVNTLKKRVFWDILIVLVMGFLLYYGSSWQIFAWYTDPAKYQCYATAFWYGIPALKMLPGPEIQCRFITQSPAGITFITNTALIQMMTSHHFPLWLISFITAQNSSQPLHALPHEYPLLTLIPFSFGLVTSAHWYQVAFAVAMALLAGGVYTLLRVWRSQKAAIAFALYIVIACWATATARFDIIPAGFTLAALLLAERRRWRWAYALLAIATMFKFYPIVFVPAFFIAQYRSSFRFSHEWWKGLDVFVLVCSAITVVSLLLSIEGTLGPLGYFGDRPVQVESTAASILWLASFFGFPLHYNATYGSLNMLSPLSSTVSPIMTILLILGLAYVCWLQWRGKISLALSLVLTLLVVICTGKVFSPQYLLWIIPFVAYVGEWNKCWLASWTVVGLLTTWIYPYIYTQTTNFLKVPTLPTFNPVIFTRNICIVIVLVVMLYHYTVQHKNAAAAVEDVPEQAKREALASMAQAD